MLGLFLVALSGPRVVTATFNFANFSDSPEVRCVKWSNCWIPPPRDSSLESRSFWSIVATGLDKVPCSFSCAKVS